jgi:ribosomal protein S2
MLYNGYILIKKNDKMLSYTLKNLSKSGFFITKENIFVDDNMVSFLFCSRNALFFLDVVQYIVNLRKVLYFFRNGI